MVLKYGTPSTVIVLSILKREQSQDDCLLSSLLVSLTFIKMFGIVTCTLAASNFVYCDFEEETSVAAWGWCPHQQSGLGRESSREHAVWTWPCSSWLVQSSLLCLHCSMSTFVTKFHCSGKHGPGWLSLGPCFPLVSVARCLAGEASGVPSDLLSLVIVMVRGPDDSGLCCWSPSANLATEVCKNK